MNNQTPTSPRFSQELRASRAVRLARKQLRSDLARYASPADRRELVAILNRHPDEQAAEIRSLLS
jgi:hypothetical protein